MRTRLLCVFVLVMAAGCPSSTTSSGPSGVLVTKVGTAKMSAMQVGDAWVFFQGNLAWVCPTAGPCLPAQTNLPVQCDCEKPACKPMCDKIPPKSYPVDFPTPPPTPCGVGPVGPGDGSGSASGGKIP